MDSKSLVERVSPLIVDRDYQEAERLLVESRQVAPDTGDKHQLHLILNELIELYSSSEPLAWDKAAALRSSESI